MQLRGEKAGFNTGSLQRGLYQHGWAMKNSSKLNHISTKST
jgi:hypothetical protein